MAKRNMLSKPLFRLPVVGNVTPMLLGLAFAAWYFVFRRNGAEVPVSGFGSRSNYYRG